MLSLTLKTISFRYLLVILFISFNINAQWTSIGPNGGSITHMAISHSDPNIIYAYVADEIFKSVDEGKLDMFPGLVSPGNNVLIFLCGIY